MLRTAIVIVWLFGVVPVYGRISFSVGGSKERIYREMSRYIGIVRGTCLEATRGLAASWLVTAPEPMRRRRPLRIIT